MTQKERAQEVNKRIQAEIKAGFFRFDCGFLYKIKETGVCAGCALGAAAFALSETPPNHGDGLGRDACINLVCRSRLMGKGDGAQLEMGYEDWKRDVIRCADGKERAFKADRTHEFYKLGKRLRKQARARGERL